MVHPDFEITTYRYTVLGPLRQCQEGLRSRAGLPPASYYAIGPLINKLCPNLAQVCVLLGVPEPVIDIAYVPEGATLISLHAGEVSIRVVEVIDPRIGRLVASLIQRPWKRDLSKHR